jgi:hypothetical protein
MGAVACAVLIGGAVVYEKDAGPPGAMPPLLTETALQGSPGAQPAQPASVATAFEPVTAESVMPLIASNSLPGPSAAPSLFGTFPELETAPVSYR